MARLGKKTGEEESLPNLVFLFGVHNHQPVGNFNSVIERAFRDGYRPFLEQMSAFPEIKFALHFSGPLWEYMQEKEKGCWELINEMVKRGQVELLGGGFYEPALTVIPEHDRQGQLRMMSDFLEENFGVKPQGAWLAERLWEPQLAKTLSQAGIKYTVLDEEHFLYAGLLEPCFPYLTEEEGHAVVIFPIDKKLRYLIPFRSLAEIEDYFRQIEAKKKLAILADDGEKFGLWPGTRKWVYEEGWLKSFLEFLCREGIQTMTYSSFLETKPEMNLAYLPPASYEEMMEWILEPAAWRQLRELKKKLPPEARRLVRGGYFPEFFLKYPESNHLHKRMLGISRWLQEKQIKEPKTLRELYRSQCNDAYWHGIFGGLYLPHLREAVYFHLLEAEKMAGLPAGWEIKDYDFDSREEIFFRHDDYSLILKPSAGGSLVELDYRPLSRNLSNILSRRPEAYHFPEEVTSEGKSIHELAKKLPPGAEALLRYDPYPRRSLLDHFLAPETKEDSWPMTDQEERGDFFNGAYDFSLAENRLILQRHGVYRENEKILPMFVKKTIIPQENDLSVEYQVTNDSAEDLSFVFGSEWNLSLLPEEWSWQPGGLWLLGGRVQMEFSPPAEVWVSPLQTLSQSEEGYDIIQQGFCFFPHWKIQLAKRESLIFRISVKIKHEP